MIQHIIRTVVLVAVCDAVKTYRPDYVYNPKTDAFYKLHTESASYLTAESVCDTEGAKLVIASSDNVVQVHTMVKQFPDIGHFFWAGEDGLPHESTEEYFNEEEDYVEYSPHQLPEKFHDNQPSPRACEVISRSGEAFKTHCFYKYPFVCKLDAKNAYFNSQCNVFSRGYQYVESVGSCYKISDTSAVWNQAFAECQGEGAHLLVLNSELEHQAVFNLTRSDSNFSSKRFLPWYHVGIRAAKAENGIPLEFKTISGQTLEEAGYAEWSPSNWGRQDLCGSITKKDGKYFDISCFYLVAFICEKEVNTNNNG